MKKAIGYGSEAPFASRFVFYKKAPKGFDFFGAKNFGGLKCTNFKI